MKIRNVSNAFRCLAIGAFLLCAACNVKDSNTGLSPETPREDVGTIDTDTDAGTNNAGSDGGNVSDAGSDQNVEMTCGNGTLDPDETCDGDCPTCDDGDPCTEDVASGTPETCDVVCANNAVTACVGGDSCCPDGCSSDTDQDCPCVPTTCADVGRDCGTLENGCGQILECGVCAATESCLDGACQASQGIGDACDATGTCPQGGACYQSNNWPGGYCTRGCPNGDADCPEGTHCEDDYNICVQTCTDNSECNAGYECYDYTGTASDPRQDGRNECLPVGSGAAPIGAACNALTDCAGGAGATCIRGWDDGYCSFKCNVDAQCPTGSHCSGNSVSGGGDCFKSCSSDAECRGPEYGCFDLSGDGRTECAKLPVCPMGWKGPKCDQLDCEVPTIPDSNKAPYCTAGFCKDPTGACRRLADNPMLARANTNSACIPALCCESPQVTGTCNPGFCNIGNTCLYLVDNPQYARDPRTTACVPAVCGLDCQEPGGGCNPGFCFDGNNGCLWLTTYTELQRGPSGECLPVACQ